MNRTIFPCRIALILAAIFTDSCSAQSRATNAKLGVAQGCTSYTPTFQQVKITTIPSMVKAGYAPFQCFDKRTRIDLSIVSVKAFKNKIGGSVKVEFTPEDEIRYDQIIVSNKNKEIVFFNKKGAIFSVIMWNPQPKYGLLINEPNMPDAERTANAVLGK
jgi:hypothetical protein